jgi:hypothetical protein
MVLVPHVTEVISIRKATIPRCKNGTSVSDKFILIFTLNFWTQSNFYGIVHFRVNAFRFKQVLL